ncbi:SYF2 splicing factor family protein [Saitoella complicata NRRL Y-17804]|uniref:Pre-mRNA-splicing factor SYF2 n=1 Tax=Saitoella complicata (strain BCRC 22490 / CBS 7301 / JCM 7358 / NBRC 10748 / NRRL Y-17804) TaxID=698492 RepID=A0A0E9NMI1_SAICN|nr:SYF2 splicing factor family protein [Saitoella complicata NRRL Y-17804]ODQ53696.1 SYF2 splicing factor family protein [Saitoella complicata NRRL Y-17804]GAO50876.1 hypothetical protein G7K_4995-t1 [Saitoella complicata NRRL Y-17804]
MPPKRKIRKPDRDEEHKEVGSPAEDDAQVKAQERAEKFKALRRRMNESATENRRDMYAEHKRQQEDPREAAKRERRRQEAEEKLAKLEAEDDGEEYSRKKNWEYTIAESRAWDERVEAKKENARRQKFADHSQSAEVKYEKQIRGLKPDLEAYKEEKARALEAGLIVATEDGVLQAVDKDGHLYRDIDSLGFVDNKPKKEAIDRLVDDLKNEELRREQERAKRAAKGNTDISYINDRNKKFNEKLSRYYDKYTKEIKDAFERGTAL